MATLTIELPAQEAQTAFNLRRWAELLEDPELAKVKGRIETDRHGHVIVSPPATFAHGSYQFKIGRLLDSALPDGRTVTECPVSTPDGMRATDAAWISRARLASIGANICVTRAPEICVEVLSPGNTRAEMAEKKALYFAAGATEVWFCNETGRMTFFTSPAPLEEKASSPLCPVFPRQIEP